MITVYPEEAGPTNLEMTLELGPFPTVGNNCTLWRGTYKQQEKVQAIKDYPLCRRNSDEALFTDEGNGIILDTQWIGGALVSPYKFANAFYIAITRMRGDLLEDEILTVDDTDVSKEVQSLRVRAIYHTEMKRVKV
jgi:hypothetical protein